MTGLGTLLRSHLRRDRWQLLWWTVGITVLFWSQAVSIEGLYTTQAEFDRAAAAMQANTAFVAMAGPARALNTVGGQVVWQASAFGAVTIGLMVMLLVVRHTRAEEEIGRDELVRATPVSRHAVTTAAMLEAVAACLLVGTGVASSLVLFPLALADSVALGVGLAATGVVFAAATLVVAQLVSSSRATYGWVGAVLGVSFALRAVGDVSEPALSWLSPIGWYQAVHAFSGLRWWPLLLPVVAAGLLTAAAYAVLARRDHGSGVWAQRPGPATASPGLGSPWGLAWRLQRGVLAGWALGMVLMGLSFGSMGADVGTLMGDGAMSDMVFGDSDDLVRGFYGTALLMLALMASGFTLSSALSPRSEELAHRTELLVGHPVPRWQLLASHVVVTGVGTVVVTMLAGGGVAAGYGLTSGDWQLAAELVRDMPAWLAPMLVLAAVAWLLLGLSARFAPWAWAGLLLAVVVMFFGDLLDLPGWLQALSPFDHVALAPAEPVRWTPVVALGLIASALTVAAHVAWSRRDLS